METKTYTLTIGTNDPNEDIDEAVRRAVGFMAEDISDSGNYVVNIAVTDPAGQLVTGSDYDPADFFTDQDGEAI